MGYQTIKHVPSCRSYARARRIHDGITPIRGNPNNVRPLGQRRDWETYSVRMNGDVVEFVLYKTPVVSFLPSGKIELKTGGWDSVSTRAFIGHVLRVPCFGQRNKSLVGIDGVPYVLGADGLTVVEKDGTLVLAQEAPVMYGYKLNRKAANNVRARYKEFADYLKAFVNLRATTVKGYWGEEREVVSCTVQEVVDVVGAMRSMGENALAGSHAYRYMDVRPTEMIASARTEHAKNYDSMCRDFFGMVSSGDHALYYKAALILMTFDSTLWVNDKNMQHIHTKPAANILDDFNEIMMRWHAEEVLVREALPPGKLPNPKYENWFSKEK